jgi:hypothetical protein
VFAQVFAICAVAMRQVDDVRALVMDGRRGEVTVNVWAAAPTGKSRRRASCGFHGVKHSGPLGVIQRVRHFDKKKKDNERNDSI